MQARTTKLTSSKESAEPAGSRPVWSIPGLKPYSAAGRAKSCRCVWCAGSCPGIGGLGCPDAHQQELIPQKPCAVALLPQNDLAGIVRAAALYEQLHVSGIIIGIGIGLTLGGCLADTAGGLSLSFCAGASTATIGLLLFAKWAAPHFLRNKLR